MMSSNGVLKSVRKGGREGYFLFGNGFYVSFWLCFWYFLVGSWSVDNVSSGWSSSLNPIRLNCCY